MQAFDDVAYPLALGRDATVTPIFDECLGYGFGLRAPQQPVVERAAAFRYRAEDSLGRRKLGTLIAFFRARRGAAARFRLRDPSDFSSNAMGGNADAD